MKILFISKHKWPRIGGVERHVKNLTDELQIKNYEVEIITEDDIKPPYIKILGLLYIWFWFIKNINLFLKYDIIHIHDVFIWVLPIRLLLFWKKFYITFHGWEGVYPIPMWNRINKKIASYLCNGGIAVGKYIEKYYGIKADKIIYGGVNPTSLKLRGARKLKNTVVWLGRRDKDTGYYEFLEWIKNNEEYTVKFVTNSKNPEKYLKTAEYCVPSGYLSYIEAKSYGCKILTFPNNSLKEDYWSEIKKLKTFPTWNKIANLYINLWN